MSAIWEAQPSICPHHLSYLGVHSVRASFESRQPAVVDRLLWGLLSVLPLPCLEAFSKALVSLGLSLPICILGVGWGREDQDFGVGISSSAGAPGEPTFPASSTFLTSIPSTPHLLSEPIKAGEGLPVGARLAELREVHCPLLLMRSFGKEGGNGQWSVPALALSLPFM